MIDPLHMFPVAPEEVVSRFILQSKLVRASDQTVKPDAFIPYPHFEASVTRHAEATDDEIWIVAFEVAAKQGRTLYGRAELLAGNCVLLNLALEAAPVEGNPNHANIVGWPAAKQDQKAIALLLAAASRFVHRS